MQNLIAWKAEINIKISLEFQSIRDQFISCTIPVSFNNMSFLEARESWPSSNMDFVRNKFGTNELLPVELFFPHFLAGFLCVCRKPAKKWEKKRSTGRGSFICTEVTFYKFYALAWLYKGAFKNSVDRIVPLLTPSPPSGVDSFYTLSVDKNRYFLTPSPLILST